MLILELYVFVLAGFVGYMVIQRVPPLLHTPLMAATNMISGISLVGSIIMAGAQHNREQQFFPLRGGCNPLQDRASRLLLDERQPHPLKVSFKQRNQAIASRCGPIAHDC